MTNADFFRAFAKDTTTLSAKNVEYYFEHSREDFSNLYDADSENDDQIKMFHYTKSIDIIKNDSNFVDGVKYRGDMVILLKSDIDGVIDVQNETDKDDGKYEMHIKSMIDNGGIIKQIIDYNACTDVHEISFSNLREVYNYLDFNADGIWLDYELTINV